MITKPYVEIWERISIERQVWEQSFDKGKTWQTVDWSMYPRFPFSSIEPDSSWTSARMLQEREAELLYPRHFGKLKE
jgi:hypothetical protein